MNHYWLLFLLAFPIWLRLQRWNSRRRGLPPGPRPLPIIGNILQLGRNPHHSLTHLAKTYGPVISLQLGSIYTVVVSSPKAAKEVLQKQDAVFSGRSMVIATTAHDHNEISVVVMSAGNQWKKLRRICKEKLFSTLCLDGSQRLREERLEKLREYVDECSEGGRAMNVGEATFVTMMNLMWATIFSVEFTRFDSDMNLELKAVINGVTRYIGLPNVADFFPVFAPLDPQGIKRKVTMYMGRLLDIMEDMIQQRLRFRSGCIDYQKKNDFLETLLDISQGSDYDLSIKEIKHLLMDLIIAGSDTTASTTEWAMTELLLNPDKLLKAKQELKTVLGENKQIKESDIARLPYLRAVIKETFRCHPPAPLLAPHKTEAEVQLFGYTIPKDTQVLVNVWAINRDPSLWPNPSSFEPERFLDKSTDFKGTDFELIPFGAGRRICPGLPLSNRVLHTLVGTLIHDFEWKLGQVGAKAKESHRREVFGLALHKALPLKAYPFKP